MFQTRSDDPISCYGTNEIAYCIGVPVATVRIVGLSLIVDKGLEGLDPPSNTVVRQTDLDVTIRQCLLSDMNPACAIVIRRKTLYVFVTLSPTNVEIFTVAESRPTSRSTVLLVSLTV